LARVSLKNVNKVFQGVSPLRKSWLEFWKPGQKKVDVHVVKDLSLNIEDGEFLVLVGPSGCGKSTTLRMVAGLEDLTDGEIYIGDRLVNDVSPKDRDIAMVFQNYALYPHMDVYENMAFGLRLRRFPRREIEKRVNDAASLLGIENLLHRKPKELSGGQRQRVAMGRAIVREPKVFLMDEPLSNLDAKLRVQMRAELQKLHLRLGITTIYVTHDQTEAMTLGQRIVVMRDGVIQQADTPLKVYENPANRYVAGFIGSPAMNFVNSRIFRKERTLRLSASGFEITVPPEKASRLEGYADREVIFGIRPEDIYDRMFAQGETPGNTARAMVEVAETMGSEVYLHLKVGDDTLIARVDSHTQARVGEEIEVVFDLKKMHVFDSESEKAVLGEQP
jgi:multiple sugar transport system ATP-binding protein